MPRPRDSEKQNKKKIASLSALGGSVRTTALGAGALLGAGAFMLDVPTVEAGIISGTPNGNLTPGGPHFSNFGAGGPALDFFVSTNGNSISGNARANGSARAGAKLAHYAGGTLRMFGQGVKWTTAGPLGDHGNFLVGGRFWSRTYPGFEKPLKFGGMKIGRMGLGKGGKHGKGKRGHAGIPHVRPGMLSGSSSPTSSGSSSSGCCSSSPGSSTSGFPHNALLPNNQPFIDKYALFTFLNGPTTLYGWVELSLSIADSYGPNGTPDLAVIAWAWDDSGNSLPAGDTTVPTPEPATEVATGLAALALGAEGLRSWRKARKAA
jgi:hypothetical protein